MRNLLFLALLAGCPSGTGTDPAVKTNASGKPSATLKEVAAAVDSAVDRDVAPCDDFYEFACGQWLEDTPLPSDKTIWTRSFSTIYDRNEEILRQVLDDAVRDPGDDPNLQKVGAVYGACLDEPAINSAGAAPLAPWIAKTEIADLDGFAHAIGALGMVGVETPIFAEVFGDFVDPKTNILHIGQGGLGLPDRDYYLDLDEEGEAVLADYQAHIAAMLVLSGADRAAADADAAAIVAFETKLAEISLPREDLRDPQKIYNRLELEGADALMPNLSLVTFFEAAGYPDLTAINVMTPSFFEKLDPLLVATEQTTLQAYLRWQTVHAFASHLDTTFVDTDFAFYGKRLRGQTDNLPRWKRCVGYTQRHLGDVMAQIYVDRAFPGDSKDKAVEMILDIEAAFEAGLPSLEWMDDPTRERAKEKVGTLVNKIGYPENWKDYSSLEVSADSWFDDVVATRTFSSRFELDKVGNPVDPDEWFMSASDVNAYYNPLANEMAFPAGILQPPFFDRDYPTAMNYGAIGMVMGHELTHGFDDSGRQFDPNGQMVEWWEPAVVEAFEEVAQCVSDQYDGFEVQPELHVNGKLTLGENIADLGGIKETYGAYTAWVAENGPEPEVAGFTGEQLVFVAFAQGWCTLVTPETERERIATDSHSPPKFRVNGPLMNLPEFAEAFDCPVGSPMRPEDTCTVW